MFKQIALLVLAVASIVTGMSIISVPAALILGGLAVGAFALYYDFDPERKTPR